MFRIEERDHRFILNEWLKLEEVLALPAFEEIDQETVDILLNEAYKLAKEVIEPVNVPGDREGCSLEEDGTVTIPACYKEAYDAYCEAGWIGLNVEPEFGGTGAPNLVSMAANEGFVGASVAFTMYPGLTHGALALIIDEGNDAQKELFVEKMVEGTWGGTMCLTEASAGSAVGNVKTQAVKVREGFYKISGQKIFISAGDHEMVENNIHLVLARTPDAPKGIKGISIFIVPKHRVNEDGSVGEFNDVKCIGIEHKMGIKGSATATLSFGENDNCEGWLIGNEGDGIKIMFHMMNEARLGVGLQGHAVAAAAYNEALDYAKERLQGVDMRKFKDPEAPSIPIIDHPDVRRMLMIQRSYVHGMRALLMYTAKVADIALKSDDADDAKKAFGLLELLTPICKGYCTDQAFEVTRLAVQTLGGYGYCAEYPCEQHLRDTKILSIYEGTNGIQAMDLVGRKLGMKKGAIFMGFVAKMMKFLATAKESDATKAYIGEFEQSLNDLQSLAMTFMGKGMEGKMLDVLQSATPFLKFMGNLLLAWLLSDQAIVADEKLKAMFADKGVTDDAAKKALIADNDEAAFYDAKVKTAQFFCINLLPENRSLNQVMMAFDNSIMDVVL